jgi:hypothetical protein
MDSIIHSTDDNEILAETLVYLKDIYLPTAIIDYVVVELAKASTLTKPLFTLLASLEIDTLDFTDVNFSFAEDDLFDAMFEGTTCVHRLILDGVYLVPCFFKMFATASHLPSSQVTKNLLHLHVNNCDSLTDQFVSLFANSFPQLESLLMSSCPLLTADAIISITNASVFCGSLKVLDISYNTASVECMAYLTNLIAIEKLDISHIKCESSFRFIISSSNFKVLNMSFLFFLTDNDLKYILSGGHCPNNMILKSLMELYLTESCISSECLIDLMRESCPAADDCLQLQKLDISWTNENLTIDALDGLVSKCCNMIDLRLQSTDAGESTLLQITSTCQELQVLYFSRCKPESLNLQSLPLLKHLTSLNLGWAMFTTEEMDAWVETFEDFAPELEVVRKIWFRGIHRFISDEN